MTAHVRNGFDLAFKKLAVRLDKAQAGIGHEALAQRMFRAGVRFEQGRNRVVLFKKNYRIVALEASLDSALEILSRTPAEQREADKLREVLK